MTLLTEPTEIFASSVNADRCAVMFLAKRYGHPSRRSRPGLIAVLDELAKEGWYLSIRSMFDGDASHAASGLDAGFAHNVDIAGVFEAPTVASAIDGTIRLEKAGWAEQFATEWILGPREFATVDGVGASNDRPWGFLALWEWNDAWAAATPEERREYDAECDVAFKGDLALNINIAGRHRLDWASGWHHLGIWEAASPEIIDQAIAGHEQAADFKFTTSRHFIGRVRPLRELIDQE